MDFEYLLSKYRISRSPGCAIFMRYLCFYTRNARLINLPIPICTASSGEAFTCKEIFSLAASETSLILTVLALQEYNIPAVGCFGADY